jgi:hypothetical protein
MTYVICFPHTLTEYENSSDAEKMAMDLADFHGKPMDVFFVNKIKTVIPEPPKSNAVIIEDLEIDVDAEVKRADNE